MKFWIHICIELNNLGFLKSVAHINFSSKRVKSISKQIRQFIAYKVPFFLHFDPNFT